MHKGSLIGSARVAMSLLAAVAGMWSLPASAQNAAYPNKPMRVIMNYTPGSATDLVARTVSAKMAELLALPVTVEHKPSANGVLGTEYVARSAPDGYTLLFSTSGHTSVPTALYGSKLPFDIFKDIAPVSQLVISTQIILAHPGLNVRTVGDLVKAAKAQPGKLNFASVGPGSPNHMGMELLKSLAGIDMVHVPYKGGAQAMTDLLSGRVQFTLTSMPSVMSYIKTGKLIGIAVGTTQRSPAAPDIPTVAESGYPGFEVFSWYGMFAPAATPRDIIGKANATINKALADPQVIETFTRQGAEPAGGTPEHLGKTMRDEYDRWKKVIADAKIVAE